MRRSVDQSEFYTWLFGLFAVLALVLLGAGAFGVTWHAVTQRTREIGIRLSLGAQPVQIVSLFFRQSALPIVFGALVGTAAAGGLTVWLVSLLQEVAPLDPFTFTVVPAFVVACGLVAIGVPALAARRVDPRDLLFGD
jgi:putative ABC transport system permease protein